jgi:hypothetical protein
MPLWLWEIDSVPVVDRSIHNGIADSSFPDAAARESNPKAYRVHKHR